MPDPIKSRAEYERQKALYSEYMRQKNDFYKKAYGVEEAPAPAPIPAPTERPGFFRRAGTLAAANALQIGADVAEMLQGSVRRSPLSTDPRIRAAEDLVLGKPGRPAEVRKKGLALEESIPAFETPLEGVASALGIWRRKLPQP